MVTWHSAPKQPVGADQYLLQSANRRFEAGFPAVKVIGEITMGVVRQPVPPKKLQTM
jgi:hypothetical protein